MRIKGRVLAASLCGALAASFALPDGAQATTELAAVADARSVGMGGTGTSFMHNAAAVVLNPGALQGIDKFAVNLMAMPGVAMQNGAFPGAPNNPQQLDAEKVFVPFFFAGAGVRVHERVVLGLAVAPTVGFGSTYKGVNMGPLGPQDMSVTVSSMEASLAASIKLLDNLSIGVGWRATYSAMNLDAPTVDASGPARMKSELSGFSALGARVGVHYAPTRTVKLGVTYTSKVNTEMDGKTKLTPFGAPMGMSVESRQDMTSPHAVRAGGSVALLEDKLLLALDLKALFYAESNKKTVTELDIPTPMGTSTQKAEQKQDWKNVYSANLGAEYKVIDMLALRVGYSFSNSATPEKTASAMGFGPGLINTFHAGVGVQAMDALAIDLGAYYVMHSHEIKTQKYGNAGEYSMDMVMGALSATYRH